MSCDSSDSSGYYRSLYVSGCLTGTAAAIRVCMQASRLGSVYDDVCGKQATVSSCGVRCEMQASGQKQATKRGYTTNRAEGRCVIAKLSLTWPTTRCDYIVRDKCCESLNGDGGVLEKSWLAWLGKNSARV